ncbi:hypothetical protein [Corynebacterium sp. sy039]|uniref:hypothetical protein n=1 Tax=Corynebacterium sp. sy039 TaxID=2599641 RepID=UPI0011B57B15|nr:hypothetical protein [Corynebacterium sp. sy039]QDZ43179.1 hypothetical protein FQV43_08460 [Corynebacterium sp. sy039]
MKHIARFVRMSCFHIRELARTSYFLELVLSATFATAFIQLLALNAWGGQPWVGFIRTIAIGMWTVTVTASGILGFERVKGTLVFLAHSRLGTFAGIAPSITACATFGLLAIPISAAIWFFPGAVRTLPTPQVFPTFRWNQCLLCVLGALLLWLSLVVMSYIIAVVFLATPHALVYEGLLLVPLIALSGIFDISLGGTSLSQWSRFFVPSAGSVRFLMDFQLLDAALCVVVCVVWLIAAKMIVRRTASLARKNATIELV